MLTLLATILLSSQATDEAAGRAAREAERIFSALERRVARINTLSMIVIHGNFTDAESPPRRVQFPPPRHPKEDDPRTLDDCFNLWLQRWDRASHVRYHGEKATLLEHLATDGADGYGLLYISERTGWPLAMGYAPDRSTPRMTEFTHLRVTFRIPQGGRAAALRHPGHKL